MQRRELIADLRAEGEDLDALVSAMRPDEWTLPSPAVGWTIAHQIAHLAWTDELAVLAVTDPERFRAGRARNATRVDAAAAAGAAQQPQALLERWRRGRHAVAHALLGCPPDSRLAWFGPSMGVASLATARLMETWAHGQDVADALARPRVPTARLRHVADLGLRTRDYAFRLHGLVPPSQPFRVELAGPDGQPWAWGPPEAVERVCGSAEAFCLCVTRRRTPDEVDLVAHGAQARQWLRIAQAFAGPYRGDDDPVEEP